MGKKNKNKRPATHVSGSQASDKRPKISTQGSPPRPPSPPPSLIPIRYEDMPLNHKKKFFIYDDCGVLHKYIELISWLRTLGCFNGSVFAGIENLNCSIEDGYPLVEIEVITPQDKSARFLISKNTLYLIAWLARSGNVQYSGCEFLVDIATQMPEYHGNYDDDLWKNLDKPWVNVGPKAMIDAINVLDAPLLLNESLPAIIRASQVFSVHLCEAARLYAVESCICRTLVPVNNGPPCKRIYQDEENMVLRGENGQEISLNNDIYGLVKCNGCIDFDHILPTPDLICDLVHKFSLLSKIWIVYALTAFFPMTESQVSKFRMRTVKSLRCSLAVLCNINFDKILKEWRKKCETHPHINSQVFHEMELRIRNLQRQKKIRTN